MCKTRPSSSPPLATTHLGENPGFPGLTLTCGKNILLQLRTTVSDLKIMGTSQRHHCLIPPATSRERIPRLPNLTPCATSSRHVVCKLVSLRLLYHLWLSPTLNPTHPLQRGDENQLANVVTFWRSVKPGNNSGVKLNVLFLNKEMSCVHWYFEMQPYL